MAFFLVPNLGLVDLLAHIVCFFCFFFQIRLHVTYSAWPPDQQASAVEKQGEGRGYLSPQTPIWEGFGGSAKLRTETIKLNYYILEGGNTIFNSASRGEKYPSYASGRVAYIPKELVVKSRVYGTWIVGQAVNCEAKEAGYYMTTAISQRSLLEVPFCVLSAGISPRHGTILHVWDSPD